MTSRRIVIAALALATATTTVGCARTGVRDFDGFKSAVDKDAPCSELFALRDRLKKDGDIERANALLKRVGCTSPTATRTDR